MIQSLIIGALFASSVFSQDPQKKPKSAHILKAHTATKDYWNGVSAHDLFDQFGEDWAGGSTLSDGSHNPNEIKGWGSASASAWTQSKPSPQDMSANDQPAGGGQMMQPPGGQQQQQTPMQQPGGYSGGYQAGGFGYSSGGYGYSSGTGYQQQPSYGYSSGGYGYSSGTGYSTGYGTQSGYSSSGGYGYSSGTGYSTGYDQSGYSTSGGYGYSSGTTGQLPGGQPMGQAPAGGVGGMGATKGSGMMGAPGQGAGAGMMGGGAAGMMPGGKGAGAAFGAQGSVNGKCPLPHRHRKPWAFLTQEQKDMFIEGFQQVRKNGKLDIIAQTHAQHDIQNYVHYTSLFSFYHSYLVWELETAIRDLGGKFACFTMPYYDWTLDAGKEDDPSILHSGVGGDGDKENGLCVTDDETGFSWQTCSDYTAWRTIDSTDGDDDDNNDDETKAWDGSYSGYDDNTDSDTENDDVDNDGGISYSGYDNDIFKAQYISYGDAYEPFDPEEHSDDPDWEPRDPFEENPDDDLEDDELTDEALLESESVEEQCFWTQANCRANEDSPFCCLKRKKSSTVLLPTAAEIGDAMYRSKNIKEWQGYLNEWYNKVQALFGADYYAHMANGYATEDPIFWLTHSFLTHLFSLWQDCWNYNNIPKDKLDMHYNSYHPYCGTFDAQPENCPAYNLALDAPMNFYELQKTDWAMVSHKIVTVRKMWTPDFWNVVYELGPFYTQSGVNNWCDNTRDSEWFIETMDYDVDDVHTEINTYAQNLREQMINDGVEQSGVFKTVSALTCQYNRKYSKQSCWTPDLEEMEEKETCDSEEIDVSALTNQTLDDFLAFEGVQDNQCLRKIRRESFPYAEHALQVKKQLCKGDWDYQCPEYNELLYGQYASTLDSPVSKNFKKHTSFFAKSGWIWMIVINGILIIIVAIGCGIWHCSRSKTVSIPLSDDGDEQNEDENEIGTMQTSEVEEYQPLLV